MRKLLLEEVEKRHKAVCVYIHIYEYSVEAMKRKIIKVICIKFAHSFSIRKIKTTIIPDQENFISKHDSKKMPKF